MTELLALARPVLAEAFQLWGSPVTWLEIAAFVLSLAMVACNMRVNPLGWPLAIASSLAYALLFANSRLYGEAGLQLFFVAVSLWGWWQWLAGRSADGSRLDVHRTDRRTAGLALAATVLLWGLLGLLLGRGTDSDVPWLDALATAGSIVGQVMLGRKLIENWAVWLAVNLFSTALFAVKGLWLTVLRYALFAVLSAAGWLAWRRRLPPPEPARA